MPRSSRTAAFEAFVAPACARPALWRTALGAAFAAALWLAHRRRHPALRRPRRRVRHADRRARSTWRASPGSRPGPCSPPGCCRAAARRRCSDPAASGRAASALGVAVVLLVAIPSGAALALLAPPERQATLAAWAARLPLALPAILVQSAAEELAFRGFLMQSLAARFRSALVWWLLPAALFGALHWNPAELGPNAPIGVLVTTVIGLALADVTVRTGNLSAPIGLHFANNAMAMLVVAPPSPVSGLALFVSGIDAGDAGTLRLLLVADLAAILLVWAALARDPRPT